MRLLQSGETIVSMLMGVPRPLFSRSGGHDKIGATAYANLDKKGTLDPKTTLVLCGLAEN